MCIGCPGNNSIFGNTNQFIKIQNSSYSYLQESFSVAGSFLSLRLTSDSGFNAFCYGFGNVAYAVG